LRVAGKIKRVDAVFTKASPAQTLRADELDGRVIDQSSTARVAAARIAAIRSITSSGVTNGGAKRHGLIDR
jgi:hypothetical protein